MQLLDGQVSGVFDQVDSSATFEGGLDWGLRVQRVVVASARLCFGKEGVMDEWVVWPLIIISNYQISNLLLSVINNC